MKLRTLIILSALGLVLVQSSCRKKCKMPSGKNVTQNRVVKDFNEVEIGGNMNVLLVQDDTHRVEITGDENFMESIITDVSSGELRIREEGDCQGGKITVVVHAKDYTSLKLGGVIDLKNEQNMKLGDLNLEFAGGVKANLNINAGKVNTKAAGRVDMRFAGQASEHTIKMAGSGTLNALDFVVAKYSITSAGTADCKINVLNELDVVIAGNGDVEYKGSPAKISKNINGAGELKPIN